MKLPYPLVLPSSVIDLVGACEPSGERHSGWMSIVSEWICWLVVLGIGSDERLRC